MLRGTQSSNSAPCVIHTRTCIPEWPSKMPNEPRTNKAEPKVPGIAALALSSVLSEDPTQKVGVPNGVEQRLDSGVKAGLQSLRPTPRGGPLSSAM